MTTIDIIVEIRKNATGEIKEHKDTLRIEEDCYIQDYSWRDGNYSCDCNRAIFFGCSDERCGGERFSVRIKRADTEEIIYDEFNGRE